MKSGIKIVKNSTRNFCLNTEWKIQRQINKSLAPFPKELLLFEVHFLVIQKYHSWLWNVFGLAIQKLNFKITLIILGESRCDWGSVPNEVEPCVAVVLFLRISEANQEICRNSNLTQTLVIAETFNLIHEISNDFIAYRFPSLYLRLYTHARILYICINKEHKQGTLTSL